MARPKSILTPPMPAALLVAFLFFTWGCSRSTSPEAEGETPRQAGIARVVVPDDLDAGGADARSMAQALHDQAAVERVLRDRNPGLLGTAVSAVRGRPVVLALTREAQADLPARVGNSAVEQLVVGDVTAQAFYCGSSTGASTVCSAGTLGAIVTDGIRNYWLSNWHVLADNSPLVGELVVSPGRVDVACGTSTTVGTLSRWTPVKFDGTSNHVDCAIARIATGTSASPIEAAGTGSFLPSATTKAATIGLAVKKVGRTTGLTTGKVMGVNATLTVTYTGYGNARFNGVILFSPMCKAGDSGSLICTQSGNNPVALLFAASSTVAVGCPINDVFAAIGAHVAN